MTFVEVVERNSFSKAADVLGISAAAVSQQIKALEEYMELTLVHRSTRRVETTDVGIAFYQQCKSIQNELRTTETFSEVLRTKPQGRLKVVTSILFGRAFLMSHLKLFHKTYPDIQLDVDFSEELPNFDLDKIDIWMGFPNYVKSLPDSLVGRPMLRSKGVLVASPGYIAKFGVPSSTADLQSHQFIYHSLIPPQERLKKLTNQDVTIPPPVMTFNSGDATISSALDGIGLLATLEYAVSKYIVQGQLIRVLPELEYQEDTIYAFYRKGSKQVPKVSCFLDFISSQSVPK